MKSTVSERGQVVIPKPLRQKLGIRPGQQIDFRIERGRLIAAKVMDQDPVDSVYGILRLGRPIDDVLVDLRGEPDGL